MDGAVVPCSLGVNPLLTITALAERFCALLTKSVATESTESTETKTPGR